MCGERELDGPAVIGMDKACVEDCKGEDFMGMQGKMGGGKWQGKKKGFLSSLNTKTLAERKYFFIEKNFGRTVTAYFPGHLSFLPLCQLDSLEQFKPESSAFLQTS